MASSAKRVAEHRASLRAQGLRPIQLWVQDTRSPEYLALIERQCAALWASENEKQILRELEELADTDGWA
jgi:hypothetical protein